MVKVGKEVKSAAVEPNAAFDDAEPVALKQGIIG